MHPCQPQFPLLPTTNRVPIVGHRYSTTTRSVSGIAPKTVGPRRTFATMRVLQHTSKSTNSSSAMPVNGHPRQMIAVRGKKTKQSASIEKHRACPHSPQSGFVLIYATTEPTLVENNITQICFSGFGFGKTPMRFVLRSDRRSRLQPSTRLHQRLLPGSPGVRRDRTCQNTRRPPL